MRSFPAFLFVIFLLTAAGAAPTQFSRQEDSMEAKRQKELQKGLNKERIKAIKTDTDKLLDLATELKKSVDTATAEDALSLEVIRKTEEIEKLAKQVRNKMKETYVPPDRSRLPDASRDR